MEETLEQQEQNPDPQPVADPVCDAGATQESITSGDVADSPEKIIKELTGQLGAANDKYLRLFAEFDNFKRRTGKEYQQLVDMANERLLGDLIETRENFDRALKTTGKEFDSAAFVDGIKLVYSKFEVVLKKHGLETFTEVGDEFNPEFHDGLMHLHSPDVEEGLVLQVFEKGYKLKGKVIKHARVVISKGAEQPAEEPSTASGTAA